MPFTAGETEALCPGTRLSNWPSRCEPDCGLQKPTNRLGVSRAWAFHSVSSEGLLGQLQPARKELAGHAGKTGMFAPLVAGPYRLLCPSTSGSCSLFKAQPGSTSWAGVPHRPPRLAMEGLLHTTEPPRPPGLAAPCLWEALDSGQLIVIPWLSPKSTGPHTQARSPAESPLQAGAGFIRERGENVF